VLLESKYRLDLGNEAWRISIRIITASLRQYYTPPVLNVYKQNFTVYIYPPCLYRGSTPRGGACMDKCVWKLVTFGFILIRLDKEKLLTTDHVKRVVLKRKTPQ